MDNNMSGYKACYDKDTNITYLNTQGTDISLGGDIMNSIFTEAQWKNNTTNGLGLNYNQQTALAYSRGEQAENLWNRFSETANKNSNAIGASYWNSNNATSSTLIHETTSAQNNINANDKGIVVPRIINLGNEKKIPSNAAGYYEGQVVDDNKKKVYDRTHQIKLIKDLIEKGYPVSGDLDVIRIEQNKIGTDKDSVLCAFSSAVSIGKTVARDSSNPLDVVQSLVPPIIIYNEAQGKYMKGADVWDYAGIANSNGSNLAVKEAYVPVADNYKVNTKIVDSLIDKIPVLVYFNKGENVQHKETIGGYNINFSAGRVDYKSVDPGKLDDKQINSITWESSHYEYDKNNKKILTPSIVKDKETQEKVQRKGSGVIIFKENQ